MYEIGLQQALTDELGVTITGYYKDIRNLLATEIFIKNEFKKFSRLINKDYGSVQGVTLSFEKRFMGGFGASVDYTFQIAKGSASDPNAAFNNAQSNPPIEVNKQLVPLDWDQNAFIKSDINSWRAGRIILRVQLVDLVQDYPILHPCKIKELD